MRLFYRTRSLDWGTEQKDPAFAPHGPKGVVPAVNRSIQFLHEAQRVITLEMVLAKAVGRRIPSELFRTILEILLEPNPLPCSADFERIWVPWPKRATENGKVEFDHGVYWCSRERKFKEKDLDGKGD